MASYAAARVRWLADRTVPSVVPWATQMLSFPTFGRLLPLQSAMTTSSNGTVANVPGAHRRVRCPNPERSFGLSTAPLLAFMRAPTSCTSTSNV